MLQTYEYKYKCYIHYLIYFQKMVKITFKSPTQSQPFTLEIDPIAIGTVGRLKQRVGQHTNDPAANIKLIHKGKILKDETEVKTLGLAEQDTMHAVIKKENTSTQSKPAESSSNTGTSNTGSTGTNNLGGMGGFGGMGGLGGMGGMSGLGGLGGMGGMGGMGLDPQMMQQALSMMTPEMMTQMIESNPMLKSMVDSNPQMKAILSNPEMLKQMMRPEVIQAAMGGMGGMGGLAGMGGMGGGLGSMGGLGSYGGLGGFGGLGGQSASSNVDPKQAYKTQLQQLKSMGFTNQSVNIQALKATGGNVDAAVDRILNMIG